MYHTVVRSSTLNMIFAVVGMAQKEMTCVNDADYICATCFGGTHTLCIHKR